MTTALLILKKALTKMTINIGETIKSMRKDKNITQETLAKFLGVTNQSISKWERNETYPDIAMLPAIASFFNTSVDELLGINKLEQERKIQHLAFYLIIINRYTFVMGVF